MKKVVLFFTIISLFFNAIGFSGCVGGDSDLQIARNVAQDIMDCFINKDEEALYSLLSPNAQNFHLTREQIQEAFEFIDGEIISYDLPTTTGGGGHSKENGVITAKNMTPRIRNIVTNSGDIYKICFDYRLILESDRNSEGLDDIIIRLMESEYGEKYLEEVVIGIEP